MLCVVTSVIRIAEIALVHAPQVIAAIDLRSQFIMEPTVCVNVTPRRLGTKGAWSCDLQPKQFAIFFQLFFHQQLAKQIAYINSPNTNNDSPRDVDMSACRKGHTRARAHAHS